MYEYEKLGMEYEKLATKLRNVVVQLKRCTPIRSISAKSCPINRKWEQFIKQQN